MDYTERLFLLSKNLKRSAIVTSYDSSNENESDTLTHAFIDMEESFKKIENNLLPKLFENDLKGDDIDNLLLDIGEELRHILYHIKDPKYFKYLIENEK